jgi:hypothetical protein
MAISKRNLKRLTKDLDDAIEAFLLITQSRGLKGILESRVNELNAAVLTARRKLLDVQSLADKRILLKGRMKFKINQLNLKDLEGLDETNL